MGLKMGYNGNIDGMQISLERSVIINYDFWRYFLGYIIIWYKVVCSMAFFYCYICYGKIYGIWGGSKIPPVMPHSDRGQMKRIPIGDHRKRSWRFLFDMYKMGPPVDSVQLVYKWFNYGLW